jgi:hypothetical protein
MVPLELGGYSPVSISREFKADGFNVPGQVRLFLFVFDSVMFWPVIEAAHGEFHKPASLPDARDEASPLRNDFPFLLA